MAASSLCRPASASPAGARPAGARHGLRRLEGDITWLHIRLLRAMGLARRLPVVRFP